MKKRLVSILIISVVSSLTAILISHAFKILEPKQSATDPKVIVKEKKDKVFIPKKDVTLKVKPLTSTEIVKSDDQALHLALEARAYLNNGKAHELTKIQAYNEHLKTIYKVKGLSPETNALLKQVIQDVKNKLGELLKATKLPHDRLNAKDSTRRATADSTIY